MREPLPDVPRLIRNPDTDEESVDTHEVQRWAEDVVHEFKLRPRLRVVVVDVVGGQNFDLQPTDQVFPPAGIVCLRAVRDDNPASGVQVAAALSWFWKATVSGGGFCRVAGPTELTTDVKYQLTLAVVEVF